MSAEQELDMLGRSGGATMTGIRLNPVSSKSAVIFRSCGQNIKLSDEDLTALDHQGEQQAIAAAN
jgi:hypothetical protein